MNNFNIGFIKIGNDEEFKVSNVSMDIEQIYPNEKRELRTFSTLTREEKFTCNNAIINENLLLKSLLPKKPGTFDLHYTVMVQARKHRKKRINKKWLKRYGYKPIEIISEGWTVDKYNIQTGEIEMVKLA